jgi:hypothetical protein
LPSGIYLCFLKINEMVTFIKKVKSKEGINSIDIEKIKRSVPAEYKVVGNEPAVTYTANHIVIAFSCQEPKPAKAPAKTKVKAKAK